MTRSSPQHAGLVPFQSLGNFVFCFDGAVFSFERGRVYSIRGDLVAALQAAGLPILTQQDARHGR